MKSLNGQQPVAHPSPTKAFSLLGQCTRMLRIQKGEWRPNAVHESAVVHHYCRARARVPSPNRKSVRPVFDTLIGPSRAALALAFAGYVWTRSGIVFREQVWDLLSAESSRNSGRCRSSAQETVRTVRSARSVFDNDLDLAFRAISQAFASDEPRVGPPHTC